MICGLPIDWVIGLDLISFDALMGSVDREMARKDYMSLIVQRMAVNGDGKAYKDFMKDLEKRAGFDGPEDTGALARKFGRGI